jgi:hypothetical protein
MTNGLMGPRCAALGDWRKSWLQVWRSGLQLPEGAHLPWDAPVVPHSNLICKHTDGRGRSFNL